MKIGIVAISSLSGGGVSDLINQAIGLDEYDKENEYYIFLSKFQHPVLHEKLPSRFKKIYIWQLPSNVFARTVLAQFVLPFYIRKYKIDLVYCLGNVALFFVAARVVLLIQNCAAFFKGKSFDFYSKILCRFLFYLTYWSARKADCIIYVSNTSMNLFNQYLGIPKEKTKVVYHGWYPGRIIPVSDLNLLQDNVLFVGGISPYKRIAFLMQAFDEVVRRSAYPGNLLGVGGIYNKSYFKTLIALKNKLKYGERILFLNDIKHEYMFWLYTRAQMLVFTSIEETFGIPLLEAMGTGLPILAADAALGHEPNRFFNPSREICGEAALYYNPFDMEDLINKILLLLKDKVQVLALNKAAMERVKKFVGEVVVKELIGVFNSFAKEKNHLE